ncbi:hypothetical protein L1987_05998 [Smallanthus sonchifolius]|uniref:Uncharacterized protein n=1 Tax=Smallanthus sonchifolius TaxID=185202 RepID=A0ACB9JWV9_9ASTR|nr:hypothetical protein L1987_05998 [Smallanthus sonchifolius]
MTQQFPAHFFPMDFNLQKTYSDCISAIVISDLRLISDFGSPIAILISPDFSSTVCFDATAPYPENRRCAVYVSYFLISSSSLFLFSSSIAPESSTPISFANIKHRADPDKGSHWEFVSSWR